MKKLLVLIKYIRHFVNERPTPEQEANDIFQFMLLRSSTTHTIEIFEALEIIIETEMKKQEAEFAKNCRAINSKWRKDPEIIKSIDPNFNKPLSEIETNYEIINK